MVTIEAQRDIQTSEYYHQWWRGEKGQRERVGERYRLEKTAATAVINTADTITDFRELVMRLVADPLSVEALSEANS